MLYLVVYVILDCGNDNSQGENSGDFVEKEVVLAPKSGEIDDMSVVNSNLHLLYLKNIVHPSLVLISKKLTGTENYGP